MPFTLVHLWRIKFMFSITMLIVACHGNKFDSSSKRETFYYIFQNKHGGRLHRCGDQHHRQQLPSLQSTVSVSWPSWPWWASRNQRFCISTRFSDKTLFDKVDNLHHLKNWNLLSCLCLIHFQFLQWVVRWHNLS